MKSVLTILLLLLLASCEKDFVIDQHNGNNKMAVNALFDDGQPIQVFITKPYAIGAPNTTIAAIPDAQVALYEDSVFKEMIRYVPSDTQNTFGSYISNLIPQQGKRYTIQAMDANYVAATASDQIPVGAQIISSSLQHYTDSGSNQGGIMTMTFKDDPAVQNYYRINVWIGGLYHDPNNLTDTSHYFQWNAITSYPISPVSDTVRDGAFFLFSDRGFNGQQKTLQISFNTIDTTGFSSLNLYVELHTISQPNYQYFQTLNLYRASNGSSEPVFIYSNVNNGFGAFVGEHLQSLPFVIK